MAPFYEEVCKDLSWPVDQALVQKMKAANDAELKRLDDAVEDAEKNLGETEIREFMLKKAEYYSRIGDKVTIVTTSDCKKIVPSVHHVHSRYSRWQ